MASWKSIEELPCLFVKMVAFTFDTEEFLAVKSWDYFPTSQIRSVLLEGDNGFGIRPTIRYYFRCLLVYA